MNQTQKIISINEKVIWEGKPDLLVYMLGSILPLVIFFCLIIFAFFHFPLAFSSIPVNVKLIVGIPVFLFLAGFIYRLLLYPYIWYTLTDKRIIFQKGLIGRDFDYVDYDKVENATVNVGLVDKIFGRNTGSIFIYTNRIQTNYVRGNNGQMNPVAQNFPFVLSSIVDPYGVFNLFKKTSFDIKADINYPNALRPSQQEGYKTDYLPK